MQTKYLCTSPTARNPFCRPACSTHASTEFVQSTTTCAICRKANLILAASDVNKPVAGIPRALRRFQHSGSASRPFSPTRGRQEAARLETPRPRLPPQPERGPLARVLSDRSRQRQTEVALRLSQPSPHRPLGSEGRGSRDPVATGSLRSLRESAPGSSRGRRVASYSTRQERLAEGYGALPNCHPNLPLNASPLES